MAIEKLTQRQVDRADGSQPLLSDGKGLFLQVGNGGARKSFVYLYPAVTNSYQRRSMGLGSAHVVKLIDARAEHRKWRAVRQQGVDPISERDKEMARVAQEARAEAAKARRFPEVVNEWYRMAALEWTDAKHAARVFTAIEQHAFPVLEKMPMQDIDVPVATSVLQPLWDSGRVDTGMRVRGYCEKVFDFAVVKQYVDERPNPFRWKGNLNIVLARPSAVAPVQHYPSMPYEQVPAFWPSLQTMPGVSSMAMQWLIMTWSRTGETLGAVWNEIDLRKEIWSIPKERMKMRRPHRVPLNEPALLVVEEAAKLRTRSNPYVFPGQKIGQPLSNMVLLVLLQKRMGLPEFTPHGFRSSARTWGGECTAYPVEMLEISLAHETDSKTAMAYNRGDLFEKRRRLMRDWAKFVTSAPTASKAARTNVVAIRAA